MKCLPETAVAAWPSQGEDLSQTLDAVDFARAGAVGVEVRIGVGKVSTPLPARVISYAACVGEALNRDLPNLIGTAAKSVRVFSSAPKTGSYDVRDAAQSVITLAAALRSAGVAQRLEADFASTECELPHLADVPVPTALAEWIDERATRHRAASRSYAVEHAAASMFGDVAPEADAPLRVTIGGALEARFWVLRMLVRQAALSLGTRVAPAAGIILRTLRVPWYQPTAFEPLLETDTSVEAAGAALVRASNPKYGGNAGLQREARAFARAASPKLWKDLRVSDGKGLLTLAETYNIGLGTRLTEQLGAAI